MRMDWLSRKWDLPMQDELFRVAVGAVCIHNMRVLLLLRKKDAEVLPEIWELPSGGVQRGESLEDALFREVREETRLDIVVLNPVSCFTYFSKGGQRTLQVNYRAHLKSPDSQAACHSSEHADVRRVTINELSGFPTSKEVAQVIVKALELERSEEDALTNRNANRYQIGTIPNDESETASVSS